MTQRQPAAQLSTPGVAFWLWVPYSRYFIGTVPSLNLQESRSTTPVPSPLLSTVSLYGCVFLQAFDLIPPFLGAP